MSELKKISGLLNSLADKDFCFICGMVKSGTTWVQLLLDAHPEIRCRGEGHLADILANELGRATDKYNRYILGKNANVFKEIEGFPSFSKEDFHNLCSVAFAHLFFKYGEIDEYRVIAEKTPSNIRYLDFLYELFPRAKFIHIVRDGRDVAVSGWYHNLRIAPKRVRDAFDSIDAYAEHIASVWNEHLDYARRFIDKNPGAMHEVRYEDLSTQANTELKKIFTFLGVNASDDIIDQCRDKASFESLTGGRSVGEEDRSSHFRKATVLQWQTELSQSARDKFQSVSEKQLRQYGYETD